MAKVLRGEFKERIRGELTRIGKSLDEPQLDGVVAQLPAEELPPVGGLATIVLQGHWTEPVRNRFVGRLKAALKATSLGLTDAELDDLAPRCFPKAVGRGKP